MIKKAKLNLQMKNIQLNIIEKLVIIIFYTKQIDQHIHKKKI